MNTAKRSPRLNRLTSLLIAAGCIAGPAAAQTVIIGDNSTVTVNVPPSILAPFDTLILGNTASGNGTLNYSSGTLNINHAGGYSGYVTVGNDGTGAVNQSNANGGSVININGPAYSSPAPGNAPAPWGGYLFLGRNDFGQGSYGISSQNGNALSLNVQNEIQIGGSNVSTQLGGGFTCAAGCRGDFVQDGGVVTASRVTIGIGGGTGSYALFNGTLNSLVDLGNSSGGNNFFQQTGGTVNANSMFIGNGSGANGEYGLFNGTLNSGPNLLLGVFGNGTINQSGGNHNAQVVQIGSEASGTGTYNLSGGTLTIGNGLTDQLVVGHNGLGMVNMTGGTLTILNGDINTGAFSVGNNTGAVGVFTQSGGVVNAGTPCQ